MGIIPRSHHIRRAVRLLVGISATALGATLIVAPPMSGAAIGDDPVTGAVYVDVNGNGTRDAGEPGQPGVEVAATDDAGATVSAVSAGDGSYSVGVAGLGDGPFRVEFRNLPAHLTPGPNGTDNPSSVSFAEAGAVVSFGVIDADTYCQSNPDLAVTCFMTGNAVSQLTTVATFPYDAGTDEVNNHAPGEPAGYNQPEEVGRATLTETGSIYGEGWHRRSGTLYLGAFAKRYVPFGPGGSGAIYVNRNGVVSEFYNTGSTTDRTPPGGNWLNDPWLDEITNVGWGDIDVVGDRLYAVNLEESALYIFDLDPATGDLVGGAPALVVPIPGAGDAHPFALGSHAGTIYVGSIANAPLTASVQAFDPIAGAFTGTVLGPFDLTFSRGCGYVYEAVINPQRCSGSMLADWRPWGSTPDSDDVPQLDADLRVNSVLRYQSNPQPILSDLSFDAAGNMSLGFRDRFGDQAGRQIPAGTTPNPVSPLFGEVPLFLSLYSYGDTLRATPTGPATWALESNGSAGGVTGSAGNGQGPGGGEFFDGDSSIYNKSADGFPSIEGHDEVTMGGLYQHPATDEVATTGYDLFGNWLGLGVRWMHTDGNDAPQGPNTTNLNTRAYELYIAPDGGDTPFGKANGLGDLEAMCDAATVEIGNYLWYDVDGDGQQGPTEPPLVGARVSLWLGDQVIADAVTDAGGRYWFAGDDAPNVPAAPGPEWGLVPGGLPFDTDFTISIDVTTAADPAPGVSAASLSLAPQNVGPDTTDSDAGDVQGLDLIAAASGGPGENDHTFDAGYVTGDVVTTTTTTVPTSGPTSTTTTPTGGPTSSTTTVPTSVQSSTTVPTTATTTTQPTAAASSTTVPGGVLGSTTVPSSGGGGSALAFTGSAASSMTLYGVALVMFGLVVLARARRRGDTATE